MSKKYYVYSTLSNGQDYRNYSNAPGNDMPNIETTVSIKGGANVVQKDGDYLAKPAMVTEITEEQYDALKANKVFQLHEKNGHVHVSAAKAPAHEVAKDMTAKDGSAQKKPSDYPKPPKTGAVEDED